MDDYVSKPIRLEELRRVIERHAPAQINIEALLDGLDGDRKLLRELIPLFLSDAPKLLTRIERAIKRGDRDALKEAAHALKGSVGTFESGAAFQTVRYLESLGRKNNLPEAGPALTAAKAAVAKLMHGLKKLL
jgi:HPt (histidine-containing phosphotransfer) domain-containing protein